MSKNKRGSFCDMFGKKKFGRHFEKGYLHYISFKVFFVCLFVCFLRSIDEFLLRKQLLKILLCSANKVTFYVARFFKIPWLAIQPILILL